MEYKSVEILYMIPPIPSDPQVLPALTLYILDLQNDNNASMELYIVCSKISLFSSIYKSARRSTHHKYIISNPLKSHKIVIINVFVALMSVLLVSSSLDICKLVISNTLTCQLIQAGFFVFQGSSSN